MEIAAIMQTDVVSVRSDATVRDAILLLEDWHIRHLPVVDGGRLVGMVSDRDLRDYRLPLLDEIEDPDYADEMLTRPVSELMSEDVVTLDPEDSIKEAIEAMITGKLGAVPVVSSRDDELVGIVSYIDVLRMVRDTL